MSQAHEQPASGASRVSLYDEVTDRIVRELEQGCVPWVRPWKSSGVSLGLPRSAATRKFYSGINVLILWDAVIRRGFASQEWLTFRQALSIGGHVRKGERGTAICYADRFIPKKEQERAREAGDARADVAVSDDAEDIVTHFVAGGAVVAVPRSLLHLSRVERERAREHDHLADDHLGDGVRVDAGEVNERDVALGECVEIDVVDAARALRDQLEGRRFREHLPRHIVDGARNQDVRMLDAVDEGELRVGLETLDECAFDRRGDEDVFHGARVYR